jgi:hypothetical protein
LLLLLFQIFIFIFLMLFCRPLLHINARPFS